MTNEEKLLWNSISKFQFDEPGSDLRFSQRLARENRWSLKYALHAIEEYRKFIFLCVTTTNGVTPSDQVDQVWHLHLTYTKSYWKELCGKILGKEVHHNPTKGGAGERAKFTDYYSGTLKLYEEKFGMKPPADVWPGNERRFSDTNFQRVNTGMYWLIPRLRKGQIGAMKLTLLLLAGMFCIQASASNEFGVGILVMIVIGIIFFIKGGGGGRSGGNSSGGCGTSGCGTSHGCSSGGCSGCGGGGCGGD